MNCTTTVNFLVGAYVVAAFIPNLPPFAGRRTETTAMITAAIVAAATTAAQSGSDLAPCLSHAAVLMGIVAAGFAAMKLTAIKQALER